MIITWCRCLWKIKMINWLSLNYCSLQLDLILKLIIIIIKRPSPCLTILDLCSHNSLLVVSTVSRIRVFVNLDPNYQTHQEFQQHLWLVYHKYENDLRSRRGDRFSQRRGKELIMKMNLYTLSALLCLHNDSRTLLVLWLLAQGIQYH